MGKGFAPSAPTPKSPQQLSSSLSIQDVQEGLSNYFQQIPDPRVERTKKHKLNDILMIAILAIIAGAEGWEDMENYGLSKQQGLEEFLELPHGIPSDDTFRRLFQRLNPRFLKE